MGSYFIFALVLTVLYIVYFAVNIIRDLYGKKGTEKTDEEVFDLGPMDSTEESVEVSENETGFKIGNETYGTETVPAASPAAQNGDTGKKDGTAKDRLGTAESQGRGTDGKGRTLPVRRLYRRRDV